MIRKAAYYFILCLGWLYLALPADGHPAMNLYQSVDRALKHSPELKGLVHSREAVEQDLKQSRGLKLPTVDLSVGYGLEQHSDDATRQEGNVPGDDDWDPKEDASLTLTQKVYDGGETRSRISIQKALLDAARYRVEAAQQAIALDAVSAHLDVYLQRELEALAENNLRVHQEIHERLAEREEAGAGDVADVTQTRARMARAESNLMIKKADLARAVANYLRVVGSEPGDLVFGKPLAQMPVSIEAALARMETRNPELLALKAGMVEADARWVLSRSSFKPQVNLELSSNYHDNLEGSRTWQNTNEAMVVLRWNLYKGGRDKAGVKAALSRKYQSRSNRDDGLLALQESTSAVWSNYLYLQRQKRAAGEAADFSRRTFEAYLNQFSISKRSLLDVLNAESDFVQSAGQLAEVAVRETLEAYRILSLTGDLSMDNLPRETDSAQVRKGLTKWMDIFSGKDAGFSTSDADVHAPGESMGLPATASQIEEHPAAASKQPSAHTVAAKERYPAAPLPVPISPARKTALSAVEIGPCITKADTERALRYLKSRDLNARKSEGAGKVKFYRLLEGLYPPEEARNRLAAIKKSGHDGFLMPKGDQLALFVGSFRRRDGARKQKKRFAADRIMVASIVETDIHRTGTMLQVQGVDPETAASLIVKMSDLGLPAKHIHPDDP